MPQRFSHKRAAHIAKGRRSERLVADFLRRKGFRIVFQNQKTLGVEIDLLAEKQGAAALVEVKTLKEESHLEGILKERQRSRLQKAALSLAPDFPQGVSLQLAVVKGRSISFFPVSIEGSVG